MQFLQMDLSRLTSLVANDFTFDENGKDFRDYSGDFTVYNVEEAQAYWEKGLKALGTDKVKLSFLVEILKMLRNNKSGSNLNLKETYQV